MVRLAVPAREEIALGRPLMRRDRQTRRASRLFRSCPTTVPGWRCLPASGPGSAASFRRRRRSEPSFYRPLVRAIADLRHPRSKKPAPFGVQPNPERGTMPCGSVSVIHLVCLDGCILADPPPPCKEIATAARKSAGFGDFPCKAPLGGFAREIPPAVDFPCRRVNFLAGRFTAGRVCFAADNLELHPGIAQRTFRLRM